MSSKKKKESAVLRDLRFQFHYGSRSLVALLFLLFFVANFYMSQAISPLYFQVINEKKQAVVVFLQDIRKLPQFQFVLNMQERIYGESLTDDVNAEELRRRESLTALEKLHEEYPKNRDILYSLYQVNTMLGEDDKAREYLQKARTIDPALK